MLNSPMYLDDLYFGVDTIGNTYRLLFSASTILKDASMNLYKFSSNSKALKELWRRNVTSDNPSEWTMLLDRNATLIKIFLK